MCSAISQAYPLVRAYLGLFARFGQDNNLCISLRSLRAKTLLSRACAGKRGYGMWLTAAAGPARLRGRRRHGPDRSASPGPLAVRASSAGSSRQTAQGGDDPERAALTAGCRGRTERRTSRAPRCVALAPGWLLTRRPTATYRAAHKHMSTAMPSFREKSERFHRDPGVLGQGHSVKSDSVVFGASPRDSAIAILEGAPQRLMAREARQLPAGGAARSRGAGRAPCAGGAGPGPATRAATSWSARACASRPGRRRCG
jgi:hypothetical protein